MSAGFGSDVSVGTDIEALVGAVEDMPCESPGHVADGALGANHDDGPATHYYMMMHDCSWLGSGEVWAGCSALSKRIPELKKFINCMNCGAPRLKKDGWIRVIGPVGK